LYDVGAGAVVNNPDGSPVQTQTISYHPALAANRTHSSSFMLIYYGNMNDLVGNFDIQCRNNGAGLGGNNINISSNVKIWAEYSALDYSITEVPTGAWAVTDVSILIDDKDVTQEIEAEIGHTLSYGEGENEKNIDITRYLNTVGVHKVEILPDGICRINSTATPILRYSY
jgi:hypothetical protein